MQNFMEQSRRVSEPITALATAL